MKITLTIAAALLLLAPELLPAQPPPERSPSRERRRADVEERLQTMKVWKLTDELDLTEEQAGKFFPRMNELDRQMEAIEDSRRDILRELGDEVWEENADEKKINDNIESLEKLEQQRLELHRKFRQDVSGILEPDQMGKLVLFNLRFPEMMRDLIREHEPRQRPPDDGPIIRRQEW